MMCYSVKFIKVFLRAILQCSTPQQRLNDAGRFYLLIGFNTLFLLFQSQVAAMSQFVFKYEYNVTIKRCVDS